VPSNQEFKLEERILNFANKAFKVYQTQKSLRRENTTQASLLTQLRQAYLQEAVMGQLTASTTDDAHALLADIKAQKAQLIKEGKLRKEKPLPPIKPEEIPFEIPKNWVWCRLSEICSIITDGTHQTPTYFQDGFVFLSSGNVTSGKINWETVKYIDEKQHTEMQKRISPQINDILLAKMVRLVLLL